MASRSLNKVTIIGNMTRDVELRYTASGTPIATFGVATNREFTKTGEDQPTEETEFHNVVAWSKLAELCDRLLAKGQKVFIEGRLQTRSWDDEATSKKLYRTEIVANEMIVLSAPKDGVYSGSGTEPAPESKPVQGSTPATNPVAPAGDSQAGNTEVLSGEDKVPF